jgi:hypothetical protein
MADQPPAEAPQVLRRLNTPVDVGPRDPPLVRGGEGPKPPLDRSGQAQEDRRRDGLGQGREDPTIRRPTPARTGRQKAGQKSRFPSTQ